MKKDNHIHWYPGHIAKAERQLKSQLSLVDAVIEVIDARLPISSSYDNITRLLGEKPRLILLNKSDLTDTNELNKFIKINKDIKNFTFILEKENPSITSKVINKMNKITKTYIR